METKQKLMWFARVLNKGDAAKNSQSSPTRHTEHLQPLRDDTRMYKVGSEFEYTSKKKQTRRDRFLSDLEQVVFLAQLDAQVVLF